MLTNAILVLIFAFVTFVQAAPPHTREYLRRLVVVHGILIPLSLLVISHRPVVAGEIPIPHGDGQSDDPNSGQEGW